ncbi:DNA repair protein RadC [soil metagenome]
MPSNIHKLPVASKIKNPEKLSGFKELPKDQMPRERFYNHGAGSLKDEELVAIMLKTGIKGVSVLERSSELLRKYQNLHSLCSTSHEQLLENKGIGMAKAIELNACFEIARRINNEIRRIELKNNRDLSLTSPDLAIHKIKEEDISYDVEGFYVLSLNSKNKLINCRLATSGIINASLVHPRETFKIAIDNRANSIIVAHNHPSGDTNPSKEDINITARLKETGKVIGIELLDHIIFSRSENYFSFKEHDMI